MKKLILIMMMAGVIIITGAHYSYPDALSEYNEGCGHIQAKQYQEAIVRFNNALGMAPPAEGKPMIYAAMANAYFSLKNNDQALSAITSAIQLNPSNSDYYRLSGEINYKRKDYNKAIADYSSAINLNPSSAGMYFLRALAYDKTNNLAAAKADLDSAIGLNSNLGFFYSERAYINRELGNYSAALADINIAIAKDNKSYDYIERAEINDKLGDYRSALNDLNTAKQMGETVDQAEYTRIAAEAAKQPAGPVTQPPVTPPGPGTPSGPTPE